MSGSKQFGPGKDFPQMSPSSGKPILQFDPSMAANFTDLLDTFASYTGKGGKFLMVKESEDGITTAEVGDLEQIADKNHVHEQADAASLWTITHNLGKYPNVRCKDNTGANLIGDIRDISINELTIEFTEPQTGIAIIN